MPLLPCFLLKNAVVQKKPTTHFAATEGSITVKTRSVHKMGNVFIGLSKPIAAHKAFLYSKSSFGTIV